MPVVTNARAEGERPFLLAPPCSQKSRRSSHHSSMALTIFAARNAPGNPHMIPRTALPVMPVDHLAARAESCHVLLSTSRSCYFTSCLIYPITLADHTRDPPVRTVTGICYSGEMHSRRCRPRRSSGFFEGNMNSEGLLKSLPSIDAPFFSATMVEDTHALSSPDWRP